MRFEDDPEFVDKLERRMELAESAAEFARLDKEIKNMLKASWDAEGGDYFGQMSGDWMIKGKKSSNGAMKFEFIYTGEETAKAI